MNNDIFILSNEATTYRDAEEQCQVYGGKVADIYENQRRIFEDQLHRKYIKRKKKKYSEFDFATKRSKIS